MRQKFEGTKEDLEDIIRQVMLIKGYKLNNVTFAIGQVGDDRCPTADLVGFSIEVESLKRSSAPDNYDITSIEPR